MKILIGFVLMLFVALGTAAATDPAPIFHGIKLGFSLGSQFRECPWNPPKEGDIPKFISPPDRDDKANTIPCFHELGIFKPAAYMQVTGFVRLYEGFTLLKDAQDTILPLEPTLPGQPAVFVELLVPASVTLRDGTGHGFCTNL